MVLKNDGSVWSTGVNENGRGNTFVQVNDFKTPKEIAAA